MSTITVIHETIITRVPELRRPALRNLRRAVNGQKFYIVYSQRPKIMHNLQLTVNGQKNPQLTVNGQNYTQLSQKFTGLLV